MLRCAIYCRISLDDEGEGLGVARQEKDCRALAEQKGWSVGRVFVDNDTSAFRNVKRPGYEAMMAALRSGDCQAVVVYHLDRLYRRTRELEDMLELVEAGTGFAVCSGSVDLGEPMGQFMAKTAVGMAMMESQNTSRRQKRAALENAENGLPHGGPRAYGYRDEKVIDGRRKAKRTTEIDEHEAEVIRDSVARLLKGESIRSVVLRINQQGELTPFGNPFDITVFRRVLLKPRLAGLRIHKGVTYPSAWPAIISPDDHLLLTALLTNEKRKMNGGDNTPRYLLSGLAYCTECGTGMRHTPGWTRNKPSYACPPPPRGHLCTAVTQENLEGEVIKRLLDAFDNVPSLANVRLSDEEPVEVEDVRRLQAEMRALSEAEAEGSISLEQLKIGTKIRREKVEKLEAKLVEQVRVDPLQHIGAPDNMRAAWPALTLEERRDIIATFVQTVWVSRAYRSRVFRPGRVHLTPTDIGLRLGIS